MFHCSFQTPVEVEAEAKDLDEPIKDETFSEQSEPSPAVDEILDSPTPPPPAEIPTQDEPQPRKIVKRPPKSASPVYEKKVYGPVPPRGQCLVCLVKMAHAHNLNRHYQRVHGLRAPPTLEEAKELRCLSTVGGPGGGVGTQVKDVAPSSTPGSEPTASCLVCRTSMLKRELHKHYVNVHHLVGAPMYLEAKRIRAELHLDKEEAPTSIPVVEEPVIVSKPSVPSTSVLVKHKKINNNRSSGLSNVAQKSKASASTNAQKPKATTSKQIQKVIRSELPERSEETPVAVVTILKKTAVAQQPGEQGRSSRASSPAVPGTLSIKKKTRSSLLPVEPQSQLFQSQPSCSSTGSSSPRPEETAIITKKKVHVVNFEPSGWSVKVHPVEPVLPILATATITKGPKAGVVESPQDLHVCNRY